MSDQQPNIVSEGVIEDASDSDSETIPVRVISNERTPVAHITFASQYPPFPAFVYEVIKKIAVNHRFVIVDLQPIPGTKKGDGYMSEMLAIRMHGKPTTYQSTVFSDIICKRAPKNAATREEYRTKLLFEREVLMYAKVLPLMARIQRDLGLSRTAGFFCWPRCFYASYTHFRPDDAVIVLEDLRGLGYSMLDKTQLVPPEHLTLFVEQLGRMHGMSFVVQDQHPWEWEFATHMMKELIVPMMTETGFKHIFDASFKRIADLMRPTRYGTLVDNIRKHYVELYTVAFDRERIGRFGVITHGDCWSNNMMFHYDAQGLPDKISMFDYQVSHVRSPVTDLVNYVFGATNAVERAEHMDFYLDTYYANLVGMMNICGSDPKEYFTRQNFDDELRRNAFYGLLNAPLFLPSVLTNDAVDMTQVTESMSQEQIDTVFVQLDDATSAKLKRRYVEIIQFLEARGWMDELRQILAKLNETDDVRL